MSKPARGRPLASSREMLQDAAFELFLENSYARTTIEQITQRAGVSRNTFFNYFSAKSDVFWIELDDALEELSGTLAGPDSEATVHALPALEVVRAGILIVGRQFGPAQVPFALTQYELIGSVSELQASALERFSRQARTITSFLHRAGVNAGRARAVAYSALAAALAGAQEWAAAGTSRGELEPYLRAALDPVIRGFTTHQGPNHTNANG